MGSAEGKPDIESDNESYSGSVSTKRNMLSMNGGFEIFGRKFKWSRVMTSIKIAILSDKINLLIPCGPLSILVDHLTKHHVSYL